MLIKVKWTSYLKDTFYQNLLKKQNNKKEVIDNLSSQKYEEIDFLAETFPTKETSLVNSHKHLIK